MLTATDDRPMAKTKGRPRKPGGEGTQVRIDSDLASKAKYLAAERDVTVNEFLSDLLRPQIEAEFRKAARKLGGGQ